MPETNNTGRAFVKQHDRIQVTRTGQMVLLPQGYQFRTMTMEQIEQVDPSTLTQLEQDAYVARIEHLIELEEMRLQRAEETRRRQLDYIRKYGK